MEEIWKDIYFIENEIEYDYRGLYQVSNKGNVRSLGKGNSNSSKEKILKTDKNSCGYLRVTLCKNNKMKRFMVHRLVAHMFVSNPENKSQVDHINTIKDDNKSENLRWCTEKENKNNQLTKEKRRKPIIGINLITGEFRYAESLNDLCEKYNYNSSVIGSCCNKKIRKIKLNGKEYVYDYTNGVYDGFHWQYID